MQDSFDVVVIGAGPPGENAADYAAKGGLSAALVEADLVGGECSYWACMPSKALLRPVELLDAARAVPGIPVGERLDVAPVLARRDSFTHHLDDSSQVEWAEGAGITVIRGHGRLAGTKSVHVTAPDGTGRTLTARHAVVVATGSVPVIPDIPGLAPAEPWTSRDATNMREVPRRIVVIGGGVVGCEAATWLAGLGSQVTLVAVGGLLPRNEPFASELLARQFARVGVDVRLVPKVQEVRRTDEVTVVLPGGDVVADEILIATGRKPATGDVGLDTVGVQPDGPLSTDDTMTVKGVDGEWLYAVGDVTGRALLTHMGKYQARVCGDVIAARARDEPIEAPRFRATSDHGRVPQVTFTDPQVASVGLSERQARDAGISVGTVEYDIGNVAGASLLRDDYTGRAKFVVDTSRDTLVGATFVGPEVGELVHAATIALVGEVTLDQLWHAVPSYPTVSEVWLRLLETWREQS